MLFRYAGIFAAVQCKGKWENNERKSVGNTGRSGRSVLQAECIFRKSKGVTAEDQQNEIRKRVIVESAQTLENTYGAVKTYYYTVGGYRSYCMTVQIRQSLQ